MAKYTILSIGPIYETMKVADNTRAIWTVSFMFSYLMRETIQTLRTEKALKDDNFIVPCMNDEFEKYINNGQRAGLFHDRLIVSGDKADDLYDAYTLAVNSLIEIIIQTFEVSKNKKYVNKNVDPKKVKQYFENYFQSYVATVDIADRENGKEVNPVLALSAYVDAVEYEPRLAPFADEEYLHDFLRLTNLGSLQEVSFGDDAKLVSKDRCFKSLPEISAWELIRDQKEQWKKDHLCLKLSDATSLKENIKNPEQEVDEIIKLLEKTFKSSKKQNDENKDEKVFKPYHKYVAVVQADGDGFGKYLENIGNDTKKLQEFSTNIFKFASKSVETIESYGGSVIMAGGDDLLFFAPVVTDEINILTLISKIDDIFDDVFGTDSDVSMSYGVSVSYYKFPLQEAFDIAYDALVGKAKASKWINKKELNAEQVGNLTQNDVEALPAKNAIHLNIRKHSGQSHGLTLAKNTNIYKLFLTLLKNELDVDSKLHLPHALHHALKMSASLLDTIDSKSLTHFFANQFDEDVHKTKHKEALSAIIEIFETLKDGNENQHLLHTDESEDEKLYSTESPSEVVFSILSTIKLLRGDA